MLIELLMMILIIMMMMMTLPMMINTDELDALEDYLDPTEIITNQ